MKMRLVSIFLAKQIKHQVLPIALYLSTFGSLKANFLLWLKTQFPCFVLLHEQTWTVFSVPLRQRIGMAQSRVQCPRPRLAPLCKQKLLAVKGSLS